MARWKLPLLLLVALTFCTASTGDVLNYSQLWVKRERQNVFIHCIFLFCFADDVHLFVRGNVIEGVSSLCRNETANVAVFVSCKIRTARRQGEECSLFYMHRRGFEGSCEPRFTLQTRNQTLFLHLAGLTPQDSGKYTCECSNSAGTHNLSLNVVVEGESSFPFQNWHIYSRACLPFAFMCEVVWTWSMTGLPTSP